MAIEGKNLPAKVKCALNLQGRRGGLPRAPLQPVARAEQESILRALQRSELLGAEARHAS